MTTVQESFVAPGGVEPGSLTHYMDLWGTEPIAGYFAGDTIYTSRKFSGDSWLATNVVGNDDPGLAPSGTVYRLRTTWPGQLKELDRFISVPALGGPHQVGDIEVDAPTSISSSALSSHEQDISLHGGGQELAIAHITTNTSTTGTIIDVAGAAITFTVPPGPFFVEVRSAMRLTTAAAGIEGQPSLCLGNNQAMQNHNQRNTFDGQILPVSLGIRVPCPMAGHTPVPGSEQTYKLRLARGNVAGTAEIWVNFGAVLTAQYIRAYTLGEGAA